MRTLRIDTNDFVTVTIRGKYNPTEASKARLEALPWRYLVSEGWNTRLYGYAPDMPNIPGLSDYADLLLEEWSQEDKVKALELLGVSVDSYNGEPFLIVESWSQVADLNRRINERFAQSEAFRFWDKTIKWQDARVGVIGRALGIALDTFKDKSPYLIPAGLLDLDMFIEWGFDDEYSHCDGCYKVIRTSPDCYGWTPDYFDSGYGYICSDCVSGDILDYYLDWLQDKAASGEAVSCNLIHPPDHNFSLVLSNLANGMHPGQADDPLALLEWGSEHNLTFIFEISPGQFDIHFDVYVRDASGEKLTDNQVKDIRLALTGDKEPGQYSDYLLAEFQEYPSPAVKMQTALKSASGRFNRIDISAGTVESFDNIDDFLAS